VYNHRLLISFLCLPLVLPFLCYFLRDEEEEFDEEEEEEEDEYDGEF